MTYQRWLALVFSAAIGVMLSSLPARADSIITVNSHSTIVNLLGQEDGAEYGAISPNGPPGQSLWVEPFCSGTNCSVTELAVNAGTYDFRVIDPTDAAAAFPGLTSSQLSQIQTAWTYNSPYITDYLVFDASALTNHNENQLFLGAAQAGNTYYSPASAYNAAVSGNIANLLTVPSSLTDSGSATFSTATSYTFASPTTLVFSLPDYGTGDNGGGLSVLVTSENPQTTPEPATLWMLATGLLALALLARRQLASQQG